MPQSSGPFLMIGLLFMGISCSLFIMAFFAYAPVLCASFLGLLYVVGLYLTTETRWRWHDAQEFENRFWTVTAFLFSTAVFYAKDSPIAIGRWSSSLGGVCVLLFTLGVQFYDRQLHRVEISRKPRLKPTKSSNFSQLLFNYRATAEEKANLVTLCVEQIDRIYLPSTINNMINLKKVIRQEQKILRILTGASKEELNFILGNIKLALLFYKVKDHSGGVANLHRTLTLDLLCKKRLGELSITSRAIVLDALMVMKLSAHKCSELYVRNIILKTHGDELSQLKSLTDTKGDFQSMHKLVFSDIRNPTIKDDILAHIKQQAAIQAAHMALGTKYSRTRKMKAWRKVLSDVDDTLFSSGGRYPAGIDITYPRAVLYPGVLAFYRELDIGIAGTSNWEEGRVGHLVFLSARPHVYKDVSEKKSYAKFQNLHENKGMHTLPTLLAGSLESGRAYLWQGKLEPMAQKKFENFSEYYQLYPEFTHVFIGDNGQGDVRAAELMIEKFGASVEAVYIHIVQPIEFTHGYDEEAPERWKKSNIVFFHTYVGAAAKAYTLGHIRIESLRRVAMTAVKDFVKITSWSPEQREAARSLLNSDVSQVNGILRSVDGNENGLIPWVEKIRAYSEGAHVITVWGSGVIHGYRGRDGVYTVALRWQYGDRTRIMAYLQEKCILSEQLNDADPTNVMMTYMKNKLSGDPALKDVYPYGTVVDTSLGKGIVQKYRAKDQIYLISLTKLSRESSLFFSHKSHVWKTVLMETPSPMLEGMRSSFGFLVKPFSLFGGSKEKYSTGMVISTFFGQGIVRGYRSTDCIYEIEFKHVAAVGFLNENAISSLVVGKPTPDPKNVNESSVSRRTSRVFSLLGFSSSNSDNLNDEFPVQSYVITPFGNGTVISYRPMDDVLQLELTHLTSGSNVIKGYLRKRHIRKCEAPSSPLLSGVRSSFSFLTMSLSLFSSSSNLDEEFYKGVDVSTPLGDAVVDSIHDSKNDVVLVVLKKNSKPIGYFQKNSLSVLSSSSKKT